MADFYPDGLAARVPWHANFAAQAALTGTSHGLTAGQVTQIQADSAMVAELVNYTTAVEAFALAFTEFRDIVMEGDLNTPFPAIPAPPPELVFDPGQLAAIEARTRQYANLIKADLDYTPAIGDDYGIVTTPAAQVTPEIESADPVPGTSHIALVIAKGGYDLIAVDVRVNGGAWSELIRTQTANFTDTSAPLVPGAPETREFRCQGVVSNVRVGDLSATVSAVTTP